MQTKHIPLIGWYVSGSTLAQNFLASRYLRSMAPTYRKQRATRMACFANEGMGLELYLNGIYERPHMDAVLALVRRLSINTAQLVFCDVGANVGNHSLYLSQFFKNTYAFEPHPDVYYLLKYNLSQIKNAQCFNIALGNFSGELELYQNEENLGASTGKRRAEAVAIHVPVRKFDDIYPDDTPIGFIKIDVEGMEYEVIAGARAMISAYRPLIAFEQHQEALSKKGGSAISLLEEMGYSVCWLDISSMHRHNTFARAILRLWELVRGRTTRVALVVGPHMPQMSHTLLIAIPSEKLGALL